MTEIPKVAVLGVVFPEVADFLDDYLRSLEQQTLQLFDLILINDGFGSLNPFRHKYCLEIKELAHRGTPAELRAYGIEYLKTKGYTHVVFTDADDFFSNNRIEKALELLEGYDLVVNDLSTVSGAGRKLQNSYLSARLENQSPIEPDFILDKNIFGFTNTALRLSSMEEEVILCPNLVAVDWYLFSRLLDRGCKAVFTDETVTFYRNHGGNTVGLSSLLDGPKVRRGVRAKLAHYQTWSEINSKYRGLYENFRELSQKMGNQSFTEKYARKIQSLNIPHPLWWEVIKPLSEVGL